MASRAVPCYLPVVADLIEHVVWNALADILNAEPLF